MDPAQASVEPVGPDAGEAAAQGYIPIDLGDAVPTEHKYEYLSIRAEGVPRGARLSNGQDNGDETWSLTVADLADLVYLPSKRGLEPHSLCFRIVGVRGGFGEAICSVDVPITPESVIRGEYSTPAANPAEGFAGMAARFQVEVDSEVERRLALEKAAWEKAAEERLAETAKAQAGNLVDAERAAELEALVADAEARIEAAEQAAQEANEGLMQALARAEAAEAEAASIGMNEEAETLREQLMSARRELSSVRASMRVRSGSLEEIQKEVYDSLQDEFAHQLEELHERYGRELERLTKLLAAGGPAAGAAADSAGDGEDLEARLAEARHQWEQEVAAKLARVEGATKKAILHGREAAVAEAREQWEQEHQTRLAAAEAEWEAERPAGVDEDEVARRIESARQEWRAEIDRRIAEEQEAWGAAEQARLAAAKAEWEAEQPAGIDEDEVARRIESARQEWQAEIDRRLAEAQAAVAASGAADGDPEALAALREEWAQSHTLEIERRLLEAEQAWQAKDEERLQAAKAAWEAEQLVVIAERDERWKLELIRQLDEAKRAWRRGVEDHTPELEMPVVVAAEEAPVGVASTEIAAVPSDDVSARPEDATEIVDERLEPFVEEAVVDENMPSFFEEREAEPFQDRELGLQGRRDVAPEDDEADDVVPEWMEAWGDRLRIPPHWVPAIHRFGRRAKSFARLAHAKLRDLIAFAKAARRAAAEARQAKAAQAAATSAQTGAPLAQAPASASVQMRIGTAFYRALGELSRLASKLTGVLFKLAWAVLARLLRVGIVAGVIALLYNGYYFVKPHVYPHVKPYVESYWDPYVGPYVRVYWDPYVQPYIDTYWSGYAKPHIVNTYSTYLEPYLGGAWRTTKSVAGGAWDGLASFLPDVPPPPKVGASVSRGAAKADAAATADGAERANGASQSKDPANVKGPARKPALSAVAPRVYLKPRSATLRSDASKYSAAVGTVRQRDHLQRLGENGGWIRVRVIANNMKEGWLPGAYLADKPAR